jgi:hypothetical protein
MQEHIEKLLLVFICQLSFINCDICFFYKWKKLKCFTEVCITAVGYNGCVYIICPLLVTREKNSPTAAHACCKRRLKWVLPRLEHRTSNPVSVKNLTAVETSTLVKLLRPYVPVGTKRTSK